MKFTQNLLLFLFLSLPLMAQTNSVNQMYDELNSDPSVMAMSLGKEMITMLNLDLPKDDKTVIRWLRELMRYVLQYENRRAVFAMNQKQLLRRLHYRIYQSSDIPHYQSLRSSSIGINANYGKWFWCHILWVPHHLPGTELTRCYSLSLVSSKQPM